MARLAYYKLAATGSDTDGGSALTMAGTVPFTTTAGTLCSGVYSAANYWTTPAVLNTAFSSLSASRIQFYIYLNALDSGVAYSTNNASNFIQFQADGSMRWGTVDNGNISATAAGTFVTGTWYKVACYFDGANKVILVNDISVSSEIKNGSWGAITTGYVGNYQGGSFPINGYIRSLKFYTPQVPVDSDGDGGYTSAGAGSWPSDYFRRRGRHGR